MNSMQYFIDHLGNKSNNEYTRTHRDELYTDKSIYACPECKLCWEVDYDWRHKKKYYFYEDFPVYGKTKKTCPNCK